MTEDVKLNSPWLVAVWPGMGQVAMTAGFYLMSKLGMGQISEFSARELFDTGHVDVHDGLISTGSLPRSRLFAWTDPKGKHDIVLFIGEAQPPTGTYAFCQKLTEQARELKVERVFTFAAMATDMPPNSNARVFGAATDQEGVEEMKRLELEILQGGNIAGLNGVLLGVAAESGFRGMCLLGEMPHLFRQIPYPRASLAVLEAFSTIADIDLDLSELGTQAEKVDRSLAKLIERAEGALRKVADDEDLEQEHEGEEPQGETFRPAPPEEDKALPPADEARIAGLFEQAHEDRSRAYELKRELDRLDVFKRYEDRFLDLFRES